MSAPAERKTPRAREDAARPLTSVPTGEDSATPPAGAVLTEWVRSGAYGTDGLRTWRWDDTKGRWALLVDASVRFLAERTPAPDPDFPERDEEGEDDSLEAGADVQVTVSRGGAIRSKVYRNVRTSNLRKLTPLDRFGPSAWRGASATADGRANLFRAFNDLSAEYGMDSREFYAVTGWHPNPAGPGEVFVHGGGVIGAGGLVDTTEVRLGDQLSLLCLGEPAAGGDLVEALAATVELVDAGAMPGRVLWPLLAGALRPLFGMYRDPRDQAAATEAGAGLWVSGNTGGGKSGSMAAAINPVYPGMTYNRFPFKAGSARNGGASGPGLERLGFRARDLALPFDDLDPSEPDAIRAAWQSDLLRRAFGQYARVLATQRGQQNRAAMPWRAGVIGTGEPLDAEASAENRALNIPIGAGEIRVGLLRDHTGVDARAIRGRLGAGLVRAMAGDRGHYRARMAAARAGLRPMFVGAATDAPGPVARGGDTMAEVAATLRVLLSVLVDQGMSPADARRYWHAIEVALLEAWRAHLVVIGGGDRASRAVGYLAQAMSSGAVRLDDKADPTSPSRDMIGWTIRRSGGQFPSPDPVPMSNTVAGYQDRETGDMLLLPAVATAAVKAMADRAGDSWTGSTKTIAEALKAGGYLHSPQGGGGDPRATARPRIGGESMRLWHVIADRFHDGQDGTNYAGIDWSGPLDPTGLPCPAIDETDPATIVDPVDAPAVAQLVDEPAAPALEETRPAAIVLPTVGRGEPAECGRCGQVTTNRVDDEPLHFGGQCPPTPAVAPAGTTARPERVTVRPERSRPLRTTQADSGPVDPEAEAARAVKIIRENGYPDATDADCDAAYALFQQVTGGIRLIGDPGFVGTQWFRKWRDSNSGSVRTQEMRSELVEGISTGGDLFRYADHVRPGSVAEEGDSFVALDVSAAYLAGAGSVQLGHAEPSHYQAARDIRQITSVAKWSKRPGYVRLAEAPDLLAPVGGLDQIEAGSWVATPWVDFLLNPWSGSGPLVGKPIAVDELVYWHQGEHGKRLSVWATHVRDAELAAIAAGGLVGTYTVRMVKVIRNAFLGGYLRSEKYNHTELFRLDWSDMVVSQTGANLARKIARPAIEGTAPWPVGVYRDDVYYLADQVPAGLTTPPGPKLSAAVGTGIGQLRVKTAGRVNQAIADAIADGSAYNIASAVADLARREA